MHKFICDKCGVDMGEFCDNLLRISVPGVCDAFESLHLCDKCKSLFGVCLNGWLGDYFIKERESEKECNYCNG